jgi:predicted transcriptional regulator
MSIDKNIVSLQIALECVKSCNANYNTPNDVLKAVKNLYYDVLEVVDKDSVANVNEVKNNVIDFNFKDTITDDYIVCLEDGLKLKTLKRHLKAKYGITMNEYRKKWGLPSDYPAVCKNYSEKRKFIASNKRPGPYNKKVVNFG